MAVLSLLAHAGGTLAVEDGIVRAADAQETRTLAELRLQYIRDGEALLAATRTRCEREYADSRADIERLLAEAREDAEAMRARAYDEGMSRAMQDWHDRNADAVVDKQRSLRDLHGKLARIVTSAVERIVQSEDRAALYHRALQNVQSLTRGAASLTLRVGPQDYEHARSSLASGAGSEHGGIDVEVLSDATLRPGSCIFESDVGVLDASLETQLACVRGALERAVKRAALADEADTANPNDMAETNDMAVMADMAGSSPMAVGGTTDDGGGGSDSDSPAEAVASTDETPERTTA